jgi:serine/threonine protein phosphatase PrpC
VAGAIEVVYASATDVGIRRSHNQDAHAVLLAADRLQYEQRGHIFLVADGMGAHAVGELASKLAADNIPHLYSKYASEGPGLALRKAFEETNDAIHTRGQRNREFSGMGTTGTALLLRGEEAWVAHVGDSRVYRLRGDRLEQLTFDHSLVWERARREGCSPDQLREQIPSNIIIRSLGPEPQVQVDIDGPFPLQDRDLFILCSDGLCGPVAEPEIAAIARVLPPQEACQLLIDLANLHGGPDNITVIIVRVRKEESPERAAPRRRPFWPEWLPWPLAFLGLGVILALWAAALTRYQMEGGGVIFLLAALALLAGLTGLWLQYRQEMRQHQERGTRRRPRPYRYCHCPLDRTVVEKLAQAVADLDKRRREQAPPSNGDPCRQHCQQAQRHLQAGNLSEALCEYGRALHLLVEALYPAHSRQGRFRPLWDMWNIQDV